MFLCVVNVDYMCNVLFEIMCELMRVMIIIIEICGEILVNGEVKVVKLLLNVYCNYMKNNGG